ncbi:hypothetical protein FQA47_021206 [Oryzias melastigma]|uniref:Uncharacterized protein n=1 Tax=Oryzias melastigma TaxID=30732 RepID=A0A834CDC3_ORYME|nr:hypothetical protein FQA47_021206 [Oryzias melastigma]
MRPTEVSERQKKAGILSPFSSRGECHGVRLSLPSLPLSDCRPAASDRSDRQQVTTSQGASFTRRTRSVRHPTAHTFTVGIALLRQSLEIHIHKCRRPWERLVTLLGATKPLC